MELIEPAAASGGAANTGDLANSATVTPARPYRPSWLDTIFGLIANLPSPTWLAYLILIVPSVALSNSALWLSGLRPWGQIDPSQAFWGTATIAILAAAHHLRNVAGAAFDVFRPALGGAGGDPDAARYQLTVTPARSMLAIALFSFAITPVYYMADPEAAQVVGLTGAGLVARAVSESFTTAIVLGILYQAIRQMRRVSQLHDLAEHVDPFRPGPLYAFSRLTAQTGMVIIVFNAAGLVANPATVESESMLTLYLPWLVGFGVGAVAVFLIPLLGMHGRLERVKDNLEAAAGERLRALLAELNQAIDARASDRIADLDRAVSAVRHEQEILARLPTWPWSTGTIRGFGSALMLPIALFLIQRYLSSVLGG